MSTLTVPFTTLLVVLLQLLDPSPELSVTYLQDSRPLAEISIVEIDEADSDVYQIVVAPTELSASAEDEAQGVSRIRIEQSDLYAHVYIVYGEGPPVVVDVGAVRQQVIGLEPGEDRLIEFGGSTAPAAMSDTDVSSSALTGGELYWQSRPPVGILSYPAGGVTLIVR